MKCRSPRSSATATRTPTPQGPCRWRRAGPGRSPWRDLSPHESEAANRSQIAPWLGHEQERTTHSYLHADLEVKQLYRMTPPEGRPGRYRAPDRLLASLDGLCSPAAQPLAPRKRAVGGQPTLY